MDVVAAILAIVAVILLFLLVTTRRNAGIAAASATSSRSSLTSELASVQRARDRAVTESKTAQNEADSRVAAAQAELDAALTAQSQATERAIAAEAIQAQQVETIGSLERYNVELKTEIANAHDAMYAAQASAEAAATGLETARADAEATRLTASTGNGTGTAGIDPELLWALEITRSERTWRHSVAVDPNLPSPFPDAPDPLRFAVEVEAAAMREEVGAFIHLQWDAEAVADPIRRLLVLRVANELLAAAAREPQPFEMIASGSNEIVLLVRSTEEGDRQIHLEPPRFGTDVISFSSDEEGIKVIIR